MAHKKGLGSSKNGRDSNAQRLGVKAFGGETVTGGSISFASAARSSSPVKTSASARTIRCSRRYRGVVEFRDRGRMGKFISIKALEAVEQQ